MKKAGCLLLVVLAGCARARGPAAPAPEGAPPDPAWVREALAGMSLAEKVGQMILPRSTGFFVSETEPARRELVEAAREGRIGGVVFFRGTPYDTATLANELQLAARLPLLMASDYEWGAAFRVEGATRFPSAMALAAGGTEEDARFQAEVTAREARALGVHLILAPVVDLNRDPANSVINYRSYGEDPERVGKLAAAFIRAAQGRGVLATAKHFPGHGDTEVDSHLALPVLRHGREHLMRVELSPFRAAIAAEVAAVMTAHLAVPALDGEAARPATFSRPVLEGLLRDELGFQGLIVSDALDMGAIRGKWGVGEAAVAAAAAGCDLLLLPPEPRVAWDAVRRAVERGEISEKRIDRSVERILRAKARLGLDRRRTVDLRDLPRFVGDPRFKERVQALADRSLTLLKQPNGLLPLSLERPPRLALLTYVHEGDRVAEPAVLVEELEKRIEGLRHLPLSSATAAAGAEAVQKHCESAAVVLLASFARTRDSLGRGNLPVELVSVLAEVARSRPVIFAALGNPYQLGELPEAAALLAAYDFAPLSQIALARALFGEIEVGGKLPVRLSQVYPVGSGMTVKRRTLELEATDSPEKLGFSKGGLSAALRVLDEAVKSKAFPGGVTVVGRRGKIVVERAFGRLDYGKDSPPVTLETIYDLASLTKVLATTTTAMILYERGALSLEKPVRDYLPEFQGEGKDQVTVADLLAHSGGLLWWKDFYKEYQGPEAKKKYVEAICRMPLDYLPRSKTVYSDLGILLLGEILERVSAKPLAELFRSEVFDPLGLEATRFNPPASLRERIAPTEVDPWRGRLLRGEVHDENAFALGGVAPHAGLFATGRDVARFAQTLLNGAVYAHRRLVKRSTLERFTRRAGLVPGSSRSLGWDTPSEGSSSGRYFSASSFGHTGFTGTSLWIDPERELFVVLLTNRVHPTRENPQIQKVRPAYHDAIVEALTDASLAAERPR
jgi:beta-N-acetylhexosaminidase